MFEPYTDKQIQDVIERKLSDCWEKHNFDPDLRELYDGITHKHAVTLIAKTVAKNTGDI